MKSMGLLNQFIHIAVAEEPRAWLLLLLACYLVAGCIRPTARSRAIVEDNPDWIIVENCGYGGCYPLVDFLVGTDLTIRVEPKNSLPNNIRHNIFVVQALFVPKTKSHFEFDPSVATVELADHKTLKAKGLPCSQTIMDLDYLRSAPAFVGSISIETNACFYLFFDSRPPAVDETFKLRLNGVNKLGQPLKIPDIIFRRVVSK